MWQAVALAALSLLAAPAARAALTTYEVTARFYEPDTQPNDTVFVGSFQYDDVRRKVSSLRGMLSESMTGDAVPYPNDDMTWLELDHQLSSVYDAGLGGLLVTTFLKSHKNTFTTDFGGDGWSPDSHEGTGLYYGFPGSNPGNAYVRIFVHAGDPEKKLSQAQIDKLAYADCAPGGMMGATCMTGTTVAGYGTVGTMGGYPVSQVTKAVPEPAACLMAAAGAGVLGLASALRRRRS